MTTTPRQTTRKPRDAGASRQLLRALVTEATAGAAETLVRDLVAEGHAVFRCHPRGTDLRCAAVAGAGGCPLDRDAVDVVVDVRGDAAGELTTREYAVVCGQRAEVPVVVVGSNQPHSGGSAADWAWVSAPEVAVDEMEAAVAFHDAGAVGLVRQQVRRVIDAADRFDVRIIDHGFFVDVVVRTTADVSEETRRHLEHDLAHVVRGYRADWVHTRLTVRREERR